MYSVILKEGYVNKSNFQIHISLQPYGVKLLIFQTLNRITSLKYHIKELRHRVAVI